LGFALFLCGQTVRGDQVEMLNGDRYVGHVLSLGSDTLVIQNEFLGTLKLPRARIATISLESRSFSTNAVRFTPVTSRTNSVPATPHASSLNLNDGFDTAIKQLGSSSNFINQVQQQFLAGSGPEAQAKFNDLVSGLLNGKIGVNELRTEAKTTLDQARSMRKELGEEGGSLDSYLSILENFLKESEPTAPQPTNSASLPNSALPKITQ
jgi:hypothetical protein